MKPEVRERIRAEMRPFIEAWRTSGETRRVSVRVGTGFHYRSSITGRGNWRPRGHACRDGAPPGFAAVDVVPAPIGVGAIEIVLVGGDRLVVRAEADVSLVHAVLTALGRRC